MCCCLFHFRFRSRQSYHHSRGRVRMFTPSHPISIKMAASLPHQDVRQRRSGIIRESCWFQRALHNWPVLVPGAEVAADREFAVPPCWIRLLLCLYCLSRIALLCYTTEVVEHSCVNANVPKANAQAHRLNNLFLARMTQQEDLGDHDLCAKLSCSEILSVPVSCCQVYLVSNIIPLI